MEEETEGQQDQTDGDSHTVNLPDSSDEETTEDGGTEGEPRQESQGNGTGDLTGGELGESLRKPAQKETESGAPRPGKIYPQDLRRLHELFVPSADFLHRLNPGGNRPAYNIWIVYGSEHAGKLTTAMNLALELLKCKPDEAKVYSFRRVLTDSLALIDLVGKDQDKGRAYLLEDALDDRSKGLRELTSPWLDALDRNLKDRESFLILTTEWTLQDLEPLSIGKISAFPEDLRRVFQKHLDRFARHVEGVDVLEEVVKRARDRWEILSRFLKKPVQIERFCYKLGDLRSEADEHFEELAREAAYIGQTSVRRTFDDLEDNHKLYALLVVLFDGIERAVLDEIYTLAVRYLRGEGGDGVSTLRDEREIGMEDVLEQIHARESETRQIVIEDAELRDEVLRQVRNRRLLLYSFSNHLLSLCEQFRAPEHWEVRRAIGGALGRLAIQEKRGLAPISQALDVLARSPHGGIASVAGFILAQICREAPQFRGEVLDRLNAWVKSGHPDRMWTAGASSWRVYEALGEIPQATGGDIASRWHRRVLGVIAALIRRADRFSAEALEGASREQLAAWFHQNLQCAFFALVRICSTSPLSAADKVEEWLRSRREDPVRNVVQFACREVLEQATSGRRGLLPEQTAWLGLIEPVLTLDPDEAKVGDALMAALAHWTHWTTNKKGVDEKDTDEVYLHLLRAANRLSGRAAVALRAGLVRHWLTSESEPVRVRGRALLRRSHAMEGLPWRDFVPVPGVVLLDASQEALATLNASRVFREILEVTGCYCEVTAAHLGGARITPASPKERLEDRNLRAPFPRPRLLLPPLKQGLGEPIDPDVVVALAWGPILDLADGEELPWWPPLLVTVGDWNQPQGKENREQAGEAVAPRPVPLTQDLDCIVTGIVRHLNSRPPRPFREADRTADPWADLPALDRAEESISPPDRAARIVADLLNRSADDFAGCLRILRGWLADAGELPARIANAGLRALFRFHAEPGRYLAEPEKESLLRLAFRLPPKDEGAAETVLETVLAWMDEAPWAERITGGDDLCLAWMRWFEGLIPHQARNLDRWLSRMESHEASKKDENTAVRQVLHWLRFRLSLGAGGALPELANGKKYGLFLLDAFSSDRARGAGLARLTTDLIGRPELRDVPCLVFRLGRKAPLAVPGEKLAREAVLPAARARLPRILGPILEELPPEQVLFALILSAGPPVDSRDWSGEPWASRVRLYGPTDDSPASSEPFVRISRPYEEDKEADVILCNLKPLIEQGA